MNPIADKLRLVRRRAEAIADGHFTLFSFTTGYKGCYGTLAPIDDLAYRVIQALPGFPTLEELLDWMLTAPEREAHSYHLEEALLEEPA
ncbi:hypothetical protein [Thermus oshimai]|uniref:hypothetical protein n=1 Tax=Thermus oshimai TaxID=56957 RepID=UPI000382E2C1|nr:hypothetical protein [Thermus oshimai]